MGFLEALTLLFVALKLTDVIDWSWWAVFAPLWVGYGIALVFAALMFSTMAVVGAATGRKVNYSFKWNRGARRPSGNRIYRGH